MFTQNSDSKQSSKCLVPHVKLKTSGNIGRLLMHIIYTNRVKSLKITLFLVFLIFNKEIILMYLFIRSNI